MNEVRLIRPADGSVMTRWDVPAPIGITVDSGGDLIVTTAPGIFDPAFDPSTEAEQHGVSRILLSDGTITRLTQFPFNVLNPDGSPDPEGVFPRDAVPGPDGRMPALLGFDEFELLPDGSVVAILAFRYELVRISPQGEVTVLFGPDDGIDNPAGMTRGSGVFENDAIITSLGFVTDNAGDLAKPAIHRVRDLF